MHGSNTKLLLEKHHKGQQDTLCYITFVGSQIIVVTSQSHTNTNYILAVPRKSSKDIDSHSAEQHTMYLLCKCNYVFYIDTHHLQD